MKNKKKVGIWKYYSRDGANSLADYGDGSGEPVTKYYDRKGKLVFIGDHYVQDFFLQAFEVGEFNNEPYQYFIGFEDLKEKGILLNGLWKEYNENGVLILRTKLVEGTRDGLEEEYYESGNLRVQRFYFEDDLDLEEIYYDSGKLKRKCYHYKGKLDLETCRYYNENGNERLYDLELASVLYYDNKDYKNAYTQFKEAAKDDDILAKQFLAMMYQDGQGVEKDIERALKLYNELCEENIPETCRMAENIHLEKGSAFLENKQYTQALYHFKKVSTTENSGVQYNLAYMHHYGLGTDVDLDYAAQKYTELCEKDFFEACYALGLLYLENEGPIVEEMNSLGTSSEDNARYDELKIQRKNIYKKALKPLEKACKLKPSEDLLVTINSIKSVLE